MDYHCRAPFRPSVPWCFPVREVHFFKAICWLKDVVNSCGLQRWQTGAKRCQELSRVGPCVLQCSLTKVSEGTLGPVDYHCRAPFVLQFHGVCPSRRLVSSISSSRSQHTKSSGAATTEVAAEQLQQEQGSRKAMWTQLSRAAKSWKFAFFFTRVSEGTLGLVDYHCRAPFRPSVPWCFPVREVRFFKAIC